VSNKWKLVVKYPAEELHHSVGVSIKDFEHSLKESSPYGLDPFLNSDGIEYGKSYLSTENSWKLH
jgi:hypothetical protein